MTNHNCKACRTAVRLSHDEMAQLDTLKDKDIKLATEDVYADRLQICNACEALLYGTTCKYCGCLIPVKAKIAGAKCSYPFTPKW